MFQLWPFVMVACCVCLLGRPPAQWRLCWKVRKPQLWNAGACRVHEEGFLSHTHTPGGGLSHHAGESSSVTVTTLPLTTLRARSAARDAFLGGQAAWESSQAAIAAADERMRWAVAQRKRAAQAAQAKAAAKPTAAFTAPCTAAELLPEVERATAGSASSSRASSARRVHFADSDPDGASIVPPPPPPTTTTTAAEEAEDLDDLMSMLCNT
jgi:hypothetical protein